MRKKYTSKDGLEITVVLETYKEYLNKESVSISNLDMTPVYYIGRLERAFYKPAFLYSVTVFSFNNWDYRHLELVWADLHKSDIIESKDDNLGSMMYHIKPNEDTIAELVTESIFKQDEDLENTLEYIISKLNFKELSKPFDF